MGIAALVTWLITISGGLYMLMVWLIESDPKHPDGSPSRLPVAVISSHLLLAVSGLIVWASYLFTDARSLAWAAVAILATVALLGTSMFARWVPVYRAAEVVPVAAGQVPGVSPEPPAEHYFPLTVVVGHGVFATLTIVLVLLTALGVGGS